MTRTELTFLRDTHLEKRFWEEYKKYPYGSQVSKTDMILDAFQYEFFLMPVSMYRIIFNPNQLSRYKNKKKAS